MSEQVNQSPTWPYVLAFAKRMEAKLEQNRHKGDRSGWLKSQPHSLLKRIREESTELEDALNREESLTEIVDEAADVANFAMMIADHTGQLE